MKYTCLFFLLLVITKTQAQQVHLQGNITDAQSGQPIAGATISVQAKNYFFPADNAGKFNLSTDKIAATDSVAFSCIGYQTKRLMAGDMQRNTAVRLAPMVNMLQEVKVGANSSAWITIGSTEPYNGGTAGIKPGNEIAMFMIGSAHVKGEICLVSFFLSDGHSVAKGGDATAPFRVKLYGVDTGGMPGKELTQDVIIVSATKNEAWLDVNLSAYHIPNPDNGFFLSFCLLDAEYYKAKKGYEGIHANLASPRLGTYPHQDKDGAAYNGSHSEVFGFEWHPDYFNDSYLMRATVAPE